MITWSNVRYIWNDDKRWEADTYLLVRKGAGVEGPLVVDDMSLEFLCWLIVCGGTLK